MDQEKGLVLHHVSLADNYNLEKAGEFLTQLHLANGLTEDQVANKEVLKNLNLQEEDATIQQFLAQGQCMILGDSGAGKTSLVKSLTGKPFDRSQPKTWKMEQSLVDETWKNLGMKDLILGNLCWFCERTTVQLTLFGPANNNNSIVLRNLVEWYNRFNVVKDSLLLAILSLLFLITHGPFFTSIILLFPAFRIVYLYFFNYNYNFRLTLTTFSFSIRPCGLLVGAFLASTEVFYHYGKFSLNVYSILLIELTWVAAIFVQILCLRITWQCPYPRQLKLKYQRSLKIAWFMPFLLSVLVSHVSCSVLALLLANYWSRFGPTVRNDDEIAHNIMVCFFLYWTYELLKSAFIYKEILCKWRVRGIYKVVVTCILTVLFIVFFIRLFDMCTDLSFDSTIIVIFLCDSLFREWQNIQKLGIEGNMFTVVVMEKQELRKKKLKDALHKKFSSVKVRILDFPGDTEFHAYYQMFLRRQAFYVIVFNITEFAENNSNQIDAKCNRIQFWFETLCSHVPPNTPIFLVGTHRGDLDRKSIKKLDKHLKRHLWNTYCDELVVNDTERLVFFPVESSKGKEETGVQVLKKKITTVCKIFKETFGRKIPLSWVRAQDAIISLKEKKGAKSCVSLEEFSKVLENFDNFRCTNWSKETLKYFHETGLVIYSERDQGLDLSNWVLLKPEILVDVITQLVTPPPEFIQERGLRRDWNLLKEKGILTKSLLKNVISNVQENVEAMTAFLEECDLICPLANRKVTMYSLHDDDKQPTHFVPSLLPMSVERDTPIWHDDDTDKKCYVFFTKFLPEPLFHHLLSRAHKLSRVEFPNGQTVLFRDAGKFWFSAWQPYSLKLMKEEKMIEVTFSCRSNNRMRPSDVLCQVFCMVDGICKRNFPFVKFHCGPACPSPNCPGHQPNYVSQSVGEEQVPRRHVFNVMPGRQGDRIPFLYCENCSFEEQLDEWIP